MAGAAKNSENQKGLDGDGVGAGVGNCENIVKGEGLMLGRRGWSLVPKISRP